MASAQYAGIGEIAPPIGGDPKKPAPDPDKPAELSIETKLAVAEAERDQAERLLAERGTSTPTPPPEPAELGPPDPGKMPDPSVDPAGFEAWTEAKSVRDRWVNQQDTNSANRLAARSTRSKAIVDSYLLTRPKYQPIREIVVQCYRDACGELGIRELPENTSALDALVDKKIRAMAAAAAATVDDLPTGDPDNPKPKVTPPGRTGGLSAGSSGARTDSKAKKGEDDEPTPIPFNDVMKNRQAESPFF